MAATGPGTALSRQPVNAVSFLAWVIQFLVPTLRPGDVVIMDNLSSHKRQAVRTASALLPFLPAYCPDLNPIEQVFAKPEALLRKAGGGSVEHVEAVLGKLLDQFEPRNALDTLARQNIGQPQAHVL